MLVEEYRKQQTKFQNEENNFANKQEILHLYNIW